MRVNPSIIAKSHRSIPLICVNPVHLWLIAFKCRCPDVSFASLWIFFPRSGTPLTLLAPIAPRYPSEKASRQ
jgi:hypothetical protein